MPKQVIAIEGDTTVGTELGCVPAEATTDIADLSLDFEAETPGLVFPEPRLARLVVLELHTNSQNVTVTLVHDTTETVLSTTVSTAARARVELPIARVGSIFSVRVSATALTSRIEIGSIELDLADPQ